MINYLSPGSCDACEKKCTPIFIPVCSPDGKVLYANKCHAKCAGLTEEGAYGDCEGLNIVIPGKTPLPPGRKPQGRITPIDGNAANGVADDEVADEDQDV